MHPQCTLCERQANKLVILLCIHSILYKAAKIIMFVIYALPVIYKVTTSKYAIQVHRKRNYYLLFFQNLIPLKNYGCKNT